MQTNQAGIDLIKKFEGLRLTAYQDAVGIWTIGYGSTGRVKKGMRITETEADALLRADLGEAEAAVARWVKVPVTPNQHAALVSFAFNLGGGNLGKSTLLRKLNRKDYLGAANEFGKWVNAGGKRLAGLVRRREAEKRLFLA